jgi:acyl-CoA synthetase (AMP-forming)/AMP-acid ligase II/aryl carrier-like protein
MSVPSADGFEHFSNDSLASMAQSVASHVSGICAEKSTIALAFGPSTAFTTAFLGCVLAKMRPFAIKASYDLQASEMQQAQIADAMPSLILTERHLVQALQSQTHNRIAVIAVEDIPTARFAGSVATNDDIAFLQYSSGSTASPKGVAVTHGNLRANLQMLASTFGGAPGEAYVSWLPHYHDMGLVAAQMHCVFNGMHLVQLPPKLLLTGPLEWLRVISQFKAVLSGAPNFAFDICTQRAKADDLTGLDLSSLQVMYCGGDSIRPTTLRDFQAAFGPYGLSDSALAPGYGLAEATVFVSCSTDLTPWQSCWVDDTALQSGHIVEVDDRADAIEIIACGSTVPGQEICIVDPETCVLVPPDHVGEIWIRGAHTVLEYLNKPELSRSMLSTTLAPGGVTGWLRSGDLGFMREGKLYPTGRIKDLIILNGRNIAPSEIETPAARLSPVPSCAAFVTRTPLGDAQIELVVECPNPAEAAKIGEALWAETNALLRHRFDASLGTLSLVVSRQVPKTSSGKVQRDLCRRRAEAGMLDVIWQKRAPMPEPLEAAFLPFGARAETILPLLRQMAAPFLHDQDSPDRQDLTAAGMDSLRMMRFVLTVEEAVGHGDFVQPFLAEPTLARLAELLTDRPQPGALATEIAKNEPLQVGYSSKAQKLLARAVPYGIASRLISLSLRAFLSERSSMKIMASNTSALLSEAGSTLRKDVAIRNNQLANVAPIWRFNSLKITRNADRFISVEGLEVVLARAEGRGLVFVGTHSLLMRLLPFMSSLRFSAWAAVGNYQPYSDIRRAPGALAGRSTTRVSQMRHAAQTLKAGGHAILLADGDEGSGGIKVNLHGRARAIRPGLVELAIAGNALIVPITTSVSARGQVTFNLSTPIDVKGQRNLIEPALQLYAKVLSDNWEKEVQTLNPFGQAIHLSAPKW